MSFDMRLEVPIEEMIEYPENFFKEGEFRQYKVTGAILRRRLSQDLTIADRLNVNPHYICRVGSQINANTNMPAYTRLTRSDFPCEFEDLIGMSLVKLNLSVTKIAPVELYVFNITNIWA